MLFKILIVSCIGIVLTHIVYAKSISLTPIEEVKWEKLNPTRGNKSPQAGTLWGDRKGSPATGFLVKFVNGFSSPPHIHNVSYRAIVIAGLVHNDDPKAASMWMPTASYWTQPAGEPHITSARGETNIALVEIDSGPYLVKPVMRAFDNGERPFNMHTSNIVWRKSKSYSVVDLWANRDGEVIGSMIRYKGKISRDEKNSNMVVIKGTIQYQKQSLMPGSLIEINSKSRVELTCDSSECIFYLKKMPKK